MFLQSIGFGQFSGPLTLVRHRNNQEYNEEMDENQLIKGLLAASAGLLAAETGGKLKIYLLTCK